MDDAKTTFTLPLEDEEVAKLLRLAEEAMVSPRDLLLVCAKFGLKKVVDGKLRVIPAPSERPHHLH